MSVSQSDSGKAWEYGLARQLADVLNRSAILNISSTRNYAQNAYDAMSAIERRRMDHAASEVVVFLRTHDERLVDATSVEVQSDMMGKLGDVRDILVETSHGVIGISAKHRHSAVKHSRLSDTIDFGNDWYGIPCSSKYWNRVNPVFEDLRKRSGLWRDMERNRKMDIYMTILQAFMDETRNHADPEKMMRYLLGKHDFYKIIKENGDVSLTSFNINGTLKWGRKVALPSSFIKVSMKPGSETTALIFCEHGWQLSFRIHSAESRIIPSLKFDVQLVGQPSTMSRHQILYG